MDTGTNHLFIPGPTNVPDDVRRAMNVAQEDQRGPEFGKLTLSILEDLKSVFRTATGSVMLFSGSGTGAWEAAIKAVFVTHNETATGVTSDVAGGRAALDQCNHPALLFVDGVSSIGSLDFRMDGWGVDLAVTGSQKGLMCPAGLGILAVSEKAVAAAKTATMRRAYLEFADMMGTARTDYFPYTPPTPTLHGLRRGVAAWGLSLCAERADLASNTVTAIRTPAAVDAREVIRIGFERFNTAFGAGLSRLAGKVFRIDHLGDLNEGMTLTALAVAELALAESGADITFGSGVAAAQAYYAGSRTAQAAIAA